MSAINMRVYYRLGVFVFIFLLFLFYGVCIKLQFQEQNSEELSTAEKIEDELTSEMELKRAMVGRISQFIGFLLTLSVFRIKQKLKIAKGWKELKRFVGSMV